jgi:hypothetical protein
MTNTQVIWRKGTGGVLRVWHALCCALGHHDWTHAANEGIDPTPTQLAAGVAGFMDWATRYCRRCPRRVR